MKKCICLVTLLASVWFTGSSQKIRCSTHQHAQQMEQDDPSIAIKRASIETHTQQFIATAKKTRALVTIPVVFHVVYANAQQNIPDSFILAQLQQLNADYSKTNSDTTNTPALFKPLAANSDIQFCLAKRDPNGAATTGITRTSTVVSSFNTNDNIKFTSSGGRDAWPAGQYLNVWIGNLGSGLLGYAQFPGGPANTDGVVVGWDNVGSIAVQNSGIPYHLGRTLTHEVGHWLNLIHIWGDDANCSGSDLVGDTPNSETEFYGCPTYPQLDACATVAPGAMFMNYMDYVDDECMNMFSQGQATRMQALFGIGGARASLLTSQGCNPINPCNSMPTAGTISLSNDTLCSGTKLLSLTGNTSAPGINYQWQSSTALAGPYVNASGTATNTTYAAPAIAGIRYYRCRLTCVNGNFVASTPPVSVITYGITSVTNASICNPGITTLTANGIGSINWLATPTSMTTLASGTTFAANATTTTTYYVNTGLGTTYTVGPVNYSFGSTSTSNTFSNGEIFRSISNLTIDTIYAYPSGAGNIVVNLVDSITNTVISSYTQAVVASQANTMVGIPVNFSCNAGVTYRLLASNSTVPGLYRNTNGATHPYTVANVITISRPNSGALTTYRYFYRWRVTAGCKTPAQPVTVSIGAPALTLTAPGIACSGGTTTITAAAPNVNNFQMGTLASTTGIFTNILPGTYTITATTSSGCSATSTITLNAASPFTLNITTQNPIVTCNGTINVNSASTISSFTVSPGNSNTNLCAGIYTVCATNSNGCSTCNTTTLVLTNALYLGTNIVNSCGNTPSGSITVLPVGGIAPYTYTLNGGNSNNSGIYTNLSQGVYTVSISDINGLTTSSIVNVGITQINLSNTITPSLSFPSCNGTSNIIPSGSIGAYSYTINSGNIQSNGSFTGLCSGGYTVCAYDAQGCSACTNFNIAPVANLTLTTSQVVQPCPNSNAGSVSVITNGGFGPYMYALNGNNFANTSTFNNLVGGIYTITVKDAMNITISTTVNLTNSSSLAVNASIVNPNCSGSCNGVLTPSSINGTPPYTYVLSGNSGLGPWNSLCIGTYTLITTDANGCTSSTLAPITAPTSISCILTKADVTCSGSNNGSISALVTGGTAPYSYSIDGGLSYTGTTIYTGLAAGSYTIIVKDAYDCTKSFVTTILNPSAVAVNLSPLPNQGSITCTATGGQSPYTYIVNGGPSQSANVITNLPAGYYTITVTDSKGCIATATTYLNAPESLSDIELSKYIRVYPNPTKALIIVEFMKQYTEVELRVMNTLGQVIQNQSIITKPSITIDLSSSPQGIYQLHIVQDGVSYMKKIIRE